MVMAMVLHELLEPLKQQEQQAQQVLLVPVPELQLRWQVVLASLILQLL